MRTTSQAALLAIALAALPAACSHANFDPIASVPIGSASPLSSPGASASPQATATASATFAPSAACGTPLPGALYVAMGSYIEPSSDPTYGTVYGYAIVDSGGNYPLRATTLQIRPGDTIQFTNVDPTTAAGTDGVSHSAAGLQTAAFAPTPHVFPTSAASEVGVTLGNAQLWSTGEIRSQAASLCYSQAFVVPSSGTYFFGDVDFYNSVNMRDAIVVSAAAAR